MQHVFNRHGDPNIEAGRKQIAIVKDDFDRIPDVLMAPDKVVYGIKTDLGRDGIASIKQLSDGTTLVIEEVEQAGDIWSWPASESTPLRRMYLRLSKPLVLRPKR